MLRNLVIAASFGLFSSSALAQSWAPQSVDREGRWEASFQLLRQQSETISGSRGESARLDSDIGFGIGLTYHFTNRLALGADFWFTSPDYQATLIDEDEEPFSFNGRADIFTGQVRGTWHVLPGPITPFLEAGLGWTSIDSNVASSPPVTGCWWDPWWGFICSQFFQTYSDTSFSWSIGGGLRWDVSPVFGLRAAYTQTRVDLGGASDPGLGIARIELLWRF